MCHPFAKSVYRNPKDVVVSLLSVFVSNLAIKTSHVSNKHLTRNYELLFSPEKKIISRLSTHAWEMACLSTCTKQVLVKLVKYIIAIYHICKLVYKYITYLSVPDMEKRDNNAKRPLQEIVDDITTIITTIS